MWIKYQNTYILTIFAPKCEHLLPYPGHDVQKIVMFCFYNSVVDIVLLKGDFLVVWEDLLGRNID